MRKRVVVMKKIELLRNEASKEAYSYFDQHIRPLPKKTDGQIDNGNLQDHNNDLDAFRHAYVSGRYAQRYGKDIADILGRANEYKPGNTEGPKNMDLWNNNVGRKYGKATKSKADLLKKLKKALENGELIITPSDSRQYHGDSHHTIDPLHSVVVIEESKTGRNEWFVDLVKGTIMTLEEFGTFMNLSLLKMDGRFEN